MNHVRSPHVTALLPSLAVLLVSASLVSAQDDPNKPKEVQVASHGFADLSVPLPDGAGCIWFVAPAPVQTATGLPTGRNIFGGIPGTTYTVQAAILTIDSGTIKTRALHWKVTFGGTASPPGTDPPGTDPPVQPPITPTTLYIMVVRPDGPAAPAFTKLMADPAWDVHRKNGHTVKDFTVTDARALGASVPTTTLLPAALVLQVYTDPVDGKRKSREVKTAVHIDATTVPRLLEGLR